MDRDRFLTLWGRCGHSGDAGAAAFNELEAWYGEAQRRYHTGAHIEHCLTQVDLARGHMPDPDAIEMAIWFHDMIYYATATDNEYRSAERFKSLADGDMEPRFIDQVYRLIMATVHNHPPTRLDEQYTVDIDLSSLGLPPAPFARDSINVRDEFPHLSEQEFALKNIGFLSSLIERPRLYCTDFFRDLYEQTARRNIACQIDKLRALLSA